MPSLTPEQREYKEKTLDQLLVNLPLLESKLGQEIRPEVADSLRAQLEDIRDHIERLQQELSANVTGEPVADELFQRAASALTNRKFYLGKKFINKLETIEPFYPGIERLRQEAEMGRASRRTQAIAQRPAPPAIASTDSPAGQDVTGSPPIPPDKVAQPIVEESERPRLSQLFQFHIIISCLLVLFIFCAMAGVGVIIILQWLIEGG